ncbi:hypothetical protein PCE1_001950 [Barthelona sp. PCE]
MKYAESITIGNRTSSNKLFKSATYEGAPYLVEDDLNQYVNYYKSVTDCGIVTVGFSTVDSEERYYGLPQVSWTGDGSDHWKTRIPVALNQIREANPSTLYLQQLAHPGYFSGNDKMVPSMIEGVTEDATVLTDEQIDVILDKFVEAAVAIEKATFDGVVLHTAHHFLLSMLVSPFFNVREGKYSVVQMPGVMADLVGRIKEATGDDFIVMAKINTEDYIKPELGLGLTAGGSTFIVEQMALAGCDGFVASGAGNLACTMGAAKTGKPLPEKQAVFKAVTRMWKTALTRLESKAVVIGINLIRTGTVMDELIENEYCDMIGFGRAIMRERDLCTKLLNDIDYTGTCKNCNFCFQKLGEIGICDIEGQCALKHFRGV